MNKILKINKKILQLLGWSFFSLLLILLIHFIFTPTINTKGVFEAQKISLNSYDLYDLGVTDVNGDKKLDIFTANHSALQSLAINQGDFSFTEYLADSGISQDRQFPGVEVSNQINQSESPGLYIYRQNRLRWNDQESDNLLVLSARNLKEQIPLQGKISLNSAVKIRKNKNFQVNLQENPLSSGNVKTAIEFTVNGDGQLMLETDLTALPTDIQLEENFPLNLVHIGTNQLEPPLHKFQLAWRDRHGMAWADYNGDEKVDVFITRGGLKGKLEEIAEIYNDFFVDELFTRNSEQFEDQAQVVGLQKKDCPGRQTAWIDWNRDNFLDLYTVCGRGEPPLGEVPNQLYQQNDNLEFIDVADDVGLAFPEKGTFTWLDTNNDGYTDFLWGKKDQLQLFLNQQGEKFQLEQEISLKLGRVKKFSLADFDSDGDLDVFVVGTAESLLLINEENGLVAKQPKSIGLPNKTITANWVDYDNDGLVDLHAVPMGIFRQNVDHQFTKTDLLKHNPRFAKINDAQCTWFDANNDGFRDMLIGLNYRPWWLIALNRLPGFNVPDLRESEVLLYANNQSNGNNWSEIELVGSDRNTQALGAKIKIEAQSTQRFISVGQAEGSNFSQGHYRLYAGLAKQEAIDLVKVTWPDGKDEEFQNLPSNRLLKLKQGSGS